MGADPASSLWRNTSFARVWWAGLISWVGNGALFIALPAHVYGETNSTQVTALLVMATALPTVLVGQVAGVLVDRLQYKPVLVLANLALTLVTLAFLTGAQGPWWVLALLALAQSSVGQFLGPAEHALLPTLVPWERLGEANSLNALNNNLARLLGPALGGLLLSVAGFGGVIVFDAATYLVAALLLMGVEAPRRAQGAATPTKSVIEGWREGASVVQASASLRLVCLIAAVTGFGEGFISTLMAPFVRFMLGGGGRELGLMMSAQALGGLGGAWLLTRFAGRASPLRLLAWSALASGALLAAIFNSSLVYPAVWPALVLTAVAGLPFAAFGASQLLALQLASPPEARGRVFSVCFGLVGFTQLLGMGASGILGGKVGVLVINVDAGTYLLGGLIVLRALRQGAFRTNAGYEGDQTSAR